MSESKGVVENIEQEIQSGAPVSTEQKEKKITQFFGRRKIYTSYSAKEITPDVLVKILPEILRQHEINANEIDYLYNFYKGKQPIWEKEKVVRPEINNKVLENHAYEIVEFKKSYVFGEPIQYVQKGEKDGEKINPEISLLNTYMESEDKSSLDKEIAEWQYICGTAYRWVEVDNKGDEDDAPFELSVPDPRNTFVVYHSGIREYPLFGGYISHFSDKVMNSEEKPTAVNYRMITIYTDDKKYLFKEQDEQVKLVQQPISVLNSEVDAYPLTIKGQRIIEYPLNNSRIGLIELVMSELNTLNEIKSADIDGIMQFVQSLLVFVNQEISVDKFKELVALGAIEVSSSDPNRPADVKLLTNQLVHSETKIVLDDTYDNILSTVGIPRLNDKPSGGDTGQARLLGEGWTMADERAKQDELSFKKSERQFLKVVLAICKESNKNKEEKIKDLRLKDIEIKFTRNRSDNLLVKTQGLMNLMSAQCPPDIAFVTCGLFSDPNDVYQKARSYYGDSLWKEKSSNTKGEPNNINNPTGGGNTRPANTSTHLGKNEVGKEGAKNGEPGISTSVV
jgi:SPP1 family phage portal protein